MSNINNKHIPGDLDSLTRKDMVELFRIQLEEHQGFIKEIESLREQLAKANERVKELEQNSKDSFISFAKKHKTVDGSTALFIHALGVAFDKEQLRNGKSNG